MIEEGMEIDYIYILYSFSIVAIANDQKLAGSD